MHTCKERLFKFFFVLMFFLGQGGAVSFAQVTEAQISKAVASSGRAQVGGQLLDSILIDVESGFDIEFSAENAGDHEVRVSDFFNPEDLKTAKKERRQAAVIRITGAPFEVMIDIEELTLEGRDKDNKKVLNLSKFNIMKEGAGTAVTLQPFENDLSYALAIGGSVENITNLENTYEGFNVININYL